MFELEEFEDGEEVCIGDAAGTHLAKGVGVDDLLAEGTAGEIWALGKVEDCVEGRFIDCAAVDGP